MFRSPWLHNALDFFCSRHDRRRQVVQRRKPVRLRLESLEERLVPAQTAGSYTDLVNAVAADTAANTNYVIDITNNFTFASGGQVTVSKLGSGSTLTIEGQNGTNFTLTGNGNRLFNIVGDNVTFQDLTLTGGSAEISGGGIYEKDGNVTLNRVAVQGNTAQWFFIVPVAQGGGIYVTGNSHLLIKGGSTIQSNRAIGASAAAGGGVYVSGASTVTISDSTLRNNSAQGSNGAGAVGTIAGKSGGDGGDGQGGGLYVAGSGWTVTLMGDTLAGNTAIAGNGGYGAAGSNAAGANTSGGKGGNGGNGGDAEGGAAYFTASGSGSSHLTILNDLTAPAAHPSLFLDNSIQGGNGGNGGAGGTSTGTANNANGGDGGLAGSAAGGAISLGNASTALLTVTIGNTSFLDNNVTGSNGGVGGAVGSGGSGAAGTAGISAGGGFVDGGGLDLEGGNVTIVTSTVARNTATAGLSNGGNGTRGTAEGGGIIDNDDDGTLTLDNNTITQNTLNGATTAGSGIDVGVAASFLNNQILLNNLILGNQSTGSSANDLDVVNGKTLNNASNNFISSISAGAVSTTSNIVGSNLTQLGGVVGVSSGGKASGGPIYYPLLPGTVSVGAGTTSVLNTIAGVEGTNTANATDEIGNIRFINGAIDLGAVQSAPTSPPPSPSPPSPPALKVPPLLAFINAILGGVETVNGNGTETIIDRFFGITLFVSTFDHSGNLVSVNLFGFNITFLFV